MADRWDRSDHEPLWLTEACCADSFSYSISFPFRSLTIPLPSPSSPSHTHALDCDGTGTGLFILFFVYQWLRPILYHSVTVGWSSRARPQDVRFYRTHMDPGRSSLLRPSSSSNHVLEDVKYLTLHPLYELAPHTLFAPFPSTTKLAFWLPDCQCCESRTMNALLSLPNLREICFGHPKSFGTFVSNLTRKCVRLTHIVAFNTPWSPWKISQFPALTHLMLTLDMLVEDVDCVTALRELLAGGGRDDDGPEFQLLVLLARARSDVKHGWDMLEKCGLTDWRVIVVQRTWDTKKAWEGDADSFWDWLGETWNEGRRLRDSRRACTS